MTTKGKAVARRTENGTIIVSRTPFTEPWVVSVRRYRWRSRCADGEFESKGFCGSSDRARWAYRQSDQKMIKNRGQGGTCRKRVGREQLPARDSGASHLLRLCVQVAVPVEQAGLCGLRRASFDFSHFSTNDQEKRTGGKDCQ